MDPLEVAQEILDTMLGYLGFVVKIERDTSRSEPSLQVITNEPKPLIGRQGERLDDIQYLVNRLLQIQVPDAPRVRIDIDQYRSTQEYRLIEEAEQIAERVASSGRSAKLQPLNSYFRRIVHNHFVDHPGVKTWSPSDSARLKQITILPKADQGKPSKPSEDQD